MPNKAVHDIACVIVAEHLVLVSVATHWMSAPETIIISLGALSGIMLSPDLDMIEKRGKNWWNIYWLAYGWSIPHRHMLSHMPILSTLIRVLYALPLWALPVTLVWYFGWFHQWMFEWWIAGLMIADATHWAMDLSTTYIKRRT